MPALPSALRAEEAPQGCFLPFWQSPRTWNSMRHRVGAQEVVTAIIPRKLWLRQERPVAQTMLINPLEEVLPVPIAKSGARSRNQRWPSENIGSWAWAKSNIRELKK